MDLNNICRLCGRENVKSHHLFQDNFGNETNEIVEKILFVSSIHVFEDDGLPKNICEICLDQLDEAYSFRQQILLTDEKLRLQTSTVIKTEKEEWIKLENEDDITYVEITDNYENSESLSLEDIFQVQLCEEVDNIDNEKVILTKNKSKERPDKQKPGKSLTRVCPECGRLLKRDSYTDHMLTQHSKEFKIECEICGEKLKTKRILWHHKKTKHEDREKVSCDKCGLIFSTRNTFSRHYNTVHLGVRKHSCNLCEKTFSRLKDLRTHIRSHTGERPFICEYCNRGFSGRWALKQHKWLHTNEKPFKCQLCTEAFTQNVTLKLHVKRKHMGITPENEKQNKIQKT